MRWGNVVLGALGLAILQGILSSRGAASNVGGFVAGAGKAVAWFVDPSVPAFSVASSSSSSAATAAVTTAESIPGAGAVSPTLGQLPTSATPFPGSTVTLPPGSSSIAA